jgi:cytoplasmic tRNA 2-thiolation protein 2
LTLISNIFNRDCLPAVIMVKFRGVLDPNINPLEENMSLRGSLNAAGNLLIGYSGGLGSTVLLDLLRLCYLTPMDLTAGKGGKRHPRKGCKPWNRLIICYIECGGAYPDVCHLIVNVTSS